MICRLFYLPPQSDIHIPTSTHLTKYKIASTISLSATTLTLYPSNTHLLVSSNIEIIPPFPADFHTQIQQAGYSELPGTCPLLSSNPCPNLCTVAEGEYHPAVRMLDRIISTFPYRQASFPVSVRMPLSVRYFARASGVCPCMNSRQMSRIVSAMPAHCHVSHPAPPSRRCSPPPAFLSSGGSPSACAHPKPHRRSSIPSVEPP